MQCRCIRLYTLLLETFLMRDERHKKGRRAVKKVEWRHSKKSIRVKNGAAFCAGMCVWGGLCVSLRDPKRSWWVSNKQLHQSEEWAAKQDLSFDLPWRAAAGWMDRWVDKWMEKDRTERNRERIYWSAVQRLLSSLHVKAVSVCRETITYLLALIPQSQLEAAPVNRQWPGKWCSRHDG